MPFNPRKMLAGLFRSNGRLPDQSSNQTDQQVARQVAQQATFSGPVTIPNEPLPDYPNADQVYSYQTNDLGYGYPGEYGYGSYGGALGGWNAYGPYGGGTPTAAYPNAPTNPNKQVVLGSGAWMLPSGVEFVLSQTIDDVLARLGPLVYELMLQDDCVKSSIDTLKLGILGTGLQAIPAIVPEPGEEINEETESDRSSDIKMAKQLADECQRLTDRLPHFHDVLEELLDGCIYGCAAAEKTWARCKDGPDKGKIVLGNAIVKPREAWAFVVDAYLQVTKLWGWSIEGPVIIERDKFAIFTWAPRRGDPRGTSILRAAYNPWNFKMARHPMRAKHLTLFSDPTTVVKYAADSPGRPSYPLGKDGLPDYSQKPLTPEQMASGIAANIHSASWTAIPVGWEISFLQATNDGGAFDRANFADNQAIAQCILLSAGTTMEAKHDSQSNREASGDVTDLRYGRGQIALGTTIRRDFYKDYVLRNYTQDIADRLTPRAAFAAKTDNGTPQEISAWGSVGWAPTSRQKAAIDQKVGLPVRSAAEIDEEAEQAKKAKDAANAGMLAKGHGKSGDEKPADGGKVDEKGGDKDEDGKPVDEGDGKASGKPKPKGADGAE